MNLIDLFPVLLAAIALYRCDLSGLRSGKLNEDSLTPEASNHLRGLFALIVVYHHLYQMLGCGLLFPIFTRVGFLCVGFFFFISGYGLMKRYTTDKAYHRSFLRKRLPAILLPFTLANLVYWLFHLLRGTNYSVGDFAAGIAQGSPIASNSWYMVSLLLCYLFFWCSICLFRNRPGLVVLSNTVLCVIYTGLCIRLGFGSEWFKSIAAYPIGLAWALYEAAALERIKKSYYLLLGAAIFLLGGSMVAQMLYGNLSAPSITQAIISNFTILFFIAALVLVILKVRLGNKILAYLGKRSLEIYLFHGMFLLWAKPLLTGPDRAFLYFLMVLSGSLVFAQLVHPIEQRLLKACRQIPDHTHR